VVQVKGGKVLLGYTGSWSSHMSWRLAHEALKRKLEKQPKNAKLRVELEILEMNEPKSSPVYVSKKRYKAMKEHQKIHEYDTWLE